MESPPIARFIPPKSKKRVFPGGSSSCADPDVIEISPPVNRTPIPKSIKQKEVIHQEIIDVDLEETFADVILIDENVGANENEKEASHNIPLEPISAANSQSMDWAQYPKEKVSADGLQNIVNLDGFGSEFYSGEDNYMDTYMEDYMYEDEYAVLQSHLDNLDLPPGIEAPIPWFPSSSQNVIAGYPANLQKQESSYLPAVFSGSPTVNKTVASSSNSWTPHSSTYIGLQKNKEVKQCKSSSYGKKSIVSGGTSYNSPHGYTEGTKLSAGLNPFISGPPLAHGHKSFPLQMNTANPNGVDAQFDLLAPGPKDPASRKKNVGDILNSPTRVASKNTVDNLKGFQLFKKFDTVEDYSDHHYGKNASSLKQPSKNWVKRVQEEWKILEKDLPDTIFVRVYESRMDLLRTVIFGAEGTPYHDGLFFFDVYFPISYPGVPPLVHYHSRGLRINPNLYACGKVCLSLLNTWSGQQKEKWMPGTSTMLQVLVSIQGLILNSKPYFNEPGYAHMSGSAIGEKNSLHYNERTLLLSLQTMIYTIRNPPKHFQDLVDGHFCTRAHEILVACKAYTEGAQVGCLVRGGVQDVDEGDKSCSHNFKNSVAYWTGLLMKEFSLLGVQDMEKFAPPAGPGGSSQVPLEPPPGSHHHYPPY